MAENAILGKQKLIYRWSPTQKDYYVKSSESSLVRFFADGFENIFNNSVAADKLVKRIDQICDEQLTDIKMMGEFKINFKAGDKHFEDNLTINKTKVYYGYKMEAIYSVPGSFDSKLKTLNYEDGKFSFTFEVQEDSENYEALFEGFLDAGGALEGKAFRMPEHELLGTFKGKKLSKAKSL